MSFLQERIRVGVERGVCTVHMLGGRPAEGPTTSRPRTDRGRGVGQWTQAGVYTYIAMI